MQGSRPVRRRVGGPVKSASTELGPYAAESAPGSQCGVRAASVSTRSTSASAIRSERPTAASVSRSADSRAAVHRAARTAAHRSVMCWSRPADRPAPARRPWRAPSSDGNGFHSLQAVTDNSLRRASGSHQRPPPRHPRTRRHGTPIPAGAATSLGAAQRHGLQRSFTAGRLLIRVSTSSITKSVWVLRIPGRFRSLSRTRLRSASIVGVRTRSAMS